VISMKKCPYCSAELQENAQFCLYCMKSLGEKEQMPQKVSKKNLLTVCIVAVAVLLAVGIGLALFFGLGKSDETPGDTSDTVQTDDETAGVSADTKAAEDGGSSENVETSAVSETAKDTEPHGEDGPADEEIIVTFDDFCLRALMATAKLGCNEMWNPMDLVMTHSDDEWKTYQTDINIPDANLRIFFYNDGVEVVTAITDLTEETLPDGIKLYECILSGVENYLYPDYNDFMTDGETYPFKVRNDDDTLLDVIGFEDTALKRVDPGTTPVRLYKTSILSDNGKLFYYELREREYGGTVYYDMFMLNTREE